MVITNKVAQTMLFNYLSTISACILLSHCVNNVLAPEVTSSSGSNVPIRDSSSTGYQPITLILQDRPTSPEEAVGHSTVPKVQLVVSCVHVHISLHGGRELKWLTTANKQVGVYNSSCRWDNMAAGGLLTKYFAPKDRVYHLTKSFRQ